ncbi:hypothetical protein U2G76_002822 [Vibrio parahaemolyticus]|nr:hypothetical protein [Vibrio parahaemolyticus]
MDYKVENGTSSLLYFDNEEYNAPNYYIEDTLEPTRASQMDSLLASSLSVLLTSVPEASSSISVQIQSQPNYEKLLEELPWVYDFYTSAKSLDSSKKLLPYYKEINRLVHFNSTDEINDFLYYVDAEHMSDVLLPGLLRLTSSKKNELKYWKELKNRVEIELEQRGFDKTKLLRGLD